MGNMAAFMKRREENFERRFEEFLKKCAMGASLASAPGMTEEERLRLEEQWVLQVDSDGRDQNGRRPSAAKLAFGALVFKNAGENLAPARVFSDMGQGSPLRAEAMEMLDEVCELENCSMALQVAAMGGRLAVSGGKSYACHGMPEEEAQRKAERLAPSIAKRAALSPVLAGFCGMLAQEGLMDGQALQMLRAALEREGLGLACDEACSEESRDAAAALAPAKKPKGV